MRKSSWLLAVVRRIVGNVGYKYDPKVGDPEFPIPAGNEV